MEVLEICGSRRLKTDTNLITAKEKTAAISNIVTPAPKLVLYFPDPFHVRLTP
jgi:hypothetical protein